jgi:hypothetical protein
VSHVQPPAGGAAGLRRGVLAAAVALSIAPLAACAAGNNAQTLEVKPNTAATSVGPIEIQNALVITPKAHSSSEVVSAKIFNNGDAKQTLQGISVGAAMANLTDRDGSQTITVPAHGSVLLGGKGNPAAVLNGPSGAKNGSFHKAVFTFSETGKVTVLANVQPARGYYAKFGPTAQPSPTSSPSASPSTSPGGTKTGKSGGASSSASPTSSASATGTASASAGTKTT